MFAARYRRALKLFGLCALLVGANPRLLAFALMGDSWPAGSDVVMHLSLSRTSPGFQDGSTSWNASAADALQIWNQHLHTVRFVPGSSVATGSDDGRNSVFFSNSVYGESFGNRVIAVTVGFNHASDRTVIVETDVIFNTAERWNSYRGPLQYDSRGNPIFDFHRVALHEFGHVLGLDHPDHVGQSVYALMNSTTDDNDSITDDDIAGAQHLYGLRITSSLTPAAVNIHAGFHYQITANNNPTNYSAEGLPAGLQLDPTSGVISGASTQTGTFHVLITAYGPVRNATATLQIVVRGPVITSDLAPYSFQIGSSLTYGIRANNQTTSYSVSALPAGLRLDARTGIISGVPTLSGTYYVTITAHGPPADASGTLRLIITPLPTPTMPVKSFLMSPRQILADPVRPRLYVNDGSLQVIDTRSLVVIRTITLPRAVENMSLSTDGNVLWLAFGPWGSQYKAIGRLHLESFEFLPELQIGATAMAAREGLDNRLYVAANDGSVVQVDAQSGSFQAKIGELYTTPPQYAASMPSAIEISPDRRWLYLSTHYSQAVVKIDVSSPAARVVVSAGLGSWGRPMKLSPGGDLLSLYNGTRFTNGATVIRTDPFGTPGDIVQRPGGLYGYSVDRTRVYIGTTGKVEVFDAATSELLQTISFSGHTYAGDLVVDNTNAHLFVKADNGGPGLLVFATGLAPSMAVPTGPPKSLLNVATRLRTQPGEGALIGGFIVTGTQPKKVLLRGIGPSLPVNSRLPDPALAVYNSSGLAVAENDNWNSERASVLATGAAPNDEHEAAMVVTLQPGAYTAVLNGVGEPNGVATVEVYDLQPGTGRIANISTRGKVETGDDVMIGGFIIGGDQPTRILARAIGPSLHSGGVTDALADTTIALHDSSGALIASNDDWRSDQQQEIAATTIPPRDDRESAILHTLQPGSYTAVVRGKDETRGVALVEVYNLDAN